MLAVILLGCSLLIGVLDMDCRNIFAKKYSKTFADGVLFTGVTQLIVVVALGLMGGFALPSGTAMLLSAAYALVAITNYISFFEAVKTGPLFATVILNTTIGCTIPCIAGVFIWKESISISQLLGTLMMFASVVMITKWEKGEKPNMRWFVMTMVSSITCGGYGIVQQAFNRYCPGSENTSFLFYAFLMASIMTFVYLLLIKLRSNDVKNQAALQTSGEGGGESKKEFITWKPVGVALLLIIAVGLLCFVDNVNNLWLVGQFPAVVFFIICDGGRMVLNTVVSAVFFHEKISKIQTLGVLAGVLAVVLISGALG
ncbi:MAG: hypothetical protein Q4B67_01105 [Eubacteriales bacterium]|nr:hypothetical protein [Eubacteriales bacterium]